MKYALTIAPIDEINVGEIIQSLATLAFLPKIDLFLDKENELFNFQGEEHKMILNGKFMHNPQNWPPSKNINSLFISFCINPLVKDKMLSEKAIEYYKTHEPIGCRDYYTSELLKERGIDANFSGALALTLDKNTYIDKKYQDEIILCDILYKLDGRNKLIEKLISEKIKKKAKILVQDFNWLRDSPNGIKNKVVREKVKTNKGKFTHDEQFDITTDFLKQLANAKLVITSRLHAALSCLAFETPVIFIDGGLNEIIDSSRVNSFTKIMLNTITLEEIQQQPPKKLHELVNNYAKNNPKAYLKYRNKIIYKCKTFVNPKKGQLPKDFDWKQYIKNYPDLKVAEIDSKEKAIRHWEKYGMSEDRIYRSPIMPLPHKSTQNKIILVACARNEGPYLLEWICYHKLLGFDDIHIYSHDNEDGSEELLQKLNNKGLIRYIDMTGKIPENKKIQSYAYSNAVDKIKKLNKHSWMCVIDIDEFVVLEKHKTIQDFLEDYPDVDGITFDWKLFNSNGLFKKENNSVLDRFDKVYRREGMDKKTIARVDSLWNWSNPHLASYNKSNAKVVHPDRVPFKEKFIYGYYSTKTATVNHYFCKSFEEYIIKSHRGGGTNFGRNLTDPKIKKDPNVFIIENSRTYAKDCTIWNTQAYLRLQEYMKDIIANLNLAPMLEKIEKETLALSHRLLSKVPDEIIKNVKITLIHSTKNHFKTTKQYLTPKNFDWKQYIKNYPDLKKVGINSEEKAIQHWEEYGKKEGRTYKIPKTKKTFPHSSTKTKETV